MGLTEHSGSENEVCASCMFGVLMYFFFTLLKGMPERDIVVCSLRDARARARARVRVL